MVNTSEWARGLGITSQTAAAALKRLEIQIVNGKFDRAKATALYQKHTRVRAKSAADAISKGVTPDMPKPPPAGAASDSRPTDYQTARARREMADAEAAELRVKREMGRLIDREQAERGAFEAFRELRDSAFTACKAMARKVQDLPTLRDVELALEDEMRRTFEGWEERMKARLDAS
jgi:hypothetical protein